MPDRIDSIAADMERRWIKVTEELADKYALILKDYKAGAFTIEELAGFLAAQPPAELARGLGMQSNTNFLLNRYEEVLAGMVAHAPVTETFLASLQTLDAHIYEGINTKTAAEMQKAVFQAVVGDLNESQFRDLISTETLTPKQMNAQVNDTIRTFQRSVQTEQAQTGPENLQWIWSGPLDDRTSDDCVMMIAEGPMTYAEWQASQWSWALQSGTHFNCRHQLEAFVQQEQIGEVKRAQSVEEGAVKL